MDVTAAGGKLTTSATLLRRGRYALGDRGVPDRCKTPAGRIYGVRPGALRHRALVRLERSRRHVAADLARLRAGNLAVLSEPAPAR